MLIFLSYLLLYLIKNLINLKIKFNTLFLDINYISIQINSVIIKYFLNKPAFII